MLRAPEFVEKYRVLLPQYNYEAGDKQNGCFAFKDRGLFCIISAGGGWEHVSVSRKSRMPTYDDMDWVAKTFWEDTDTLMQLRVPITEHINLSNFCLHWWRPIEDWIPRPPNWMVG